MQTMILVAAENLAHVSDHPKTNEVFYESPNDIMKNPISTVYQKA